MSTFETPEGIKKFRSKSLLLTAPGYVTAKITGGANGVIPVSEELDKIDYPPVASVTIAYPNEAFKDGPTQKSWFRALNSACHEYRTLGTIWSSSYFLGVHQKDILCC